MIHAGDQMYFDVDVPSRAPDVEEYRHAYREAWFGDGTARAFLARCPQYMILDDHEIADGFANQQRLARHRRAALRAYREYVHARHPAGGGESPCGSESPCDGDSSCNGERNGDEERYSYRFRHGSVRFFVLDVRTQRSIEAGQMIDDDQMAALGCWLRKHQKAMKFVVSSVPFVGQLRERDAETSPSADPQDKWCGEHFRAQRDEIIDLVHQSEVERLTFLVGDMHCTYHATLRVGRPDRRFTIHELAAGPINQVQFTPRSAFHDPYHGRTGAGLPYSCVMRSFQGAAAAVLRIHVEPGEGAITWKCIPTRRPSGDRYQPPPMRGHVRFPAVAR
jgi:alkaline phosphatase D